MSLIGVFHRYTYIFHGYSGISVVFRYFGDSCDRIFVHFHSLLDYFNVSLILELNSEFRDFKLWDQKLQFKGFVSEILLEYFSGIL